MSKKLFLLILFICFSIRVLPQNIPLQYKEAMDAYNRNDFPTAIKLFDEFGKFYTIDDEFSATAHFYLAASLLKINNVSAAIPAFEFFINKYTWSNFRDEALYKLGTLYFEQGNYPVCRARLQTLIKDYQSSDFTGPALYFIGESYSAEQKYVDAIKFLESSIKIKSYNKYVPFGIYSLAYVYENLSEFKDAVAYYDTLLDYYKTSSLAPEAEIRIGICYFKLKQYDNAVLELSDPLIEDLPSRQYTEAKFILGHSFYRLREYSNAENTFRKIIEKYPFSVLYREVQYDLGWSLFQQQKYEDAFQVFDQLAKSGDDSISVNSNFWSAECKRYSGDDQWANSIYDKFLEKFPESPLASRVKLQIGITNFNKPNRISEDNLMDALNSEDRLIRAKALTILGELKLEQKYYNVAKNNFEEALSIENLSGEIESRAMLGLGVSYYYLNNYNMAINKLNQLKFKSPQFEKDKVNFFLAESYFAQKDFTNALKNYNQVDTENKELNAQLLYGKGYSYFNLRDYDNAAYSFSDFLRRYKQNTDFADARLRLADCYYGLKRYAEAGKVYKEIFLSDNKQLNNDYAHYQYAQALFKSGNAEDAIHEFSNLQDQFPNSKYVAECQYVIGWIYFQKGDFSNAIDNYKILIERYPKSPIVPITYNSIGNSYYNKEKYDSANVFYNKVIDDFPASGFVFDAINGIKDSYIAQGKPDQAISLIDSYIAGNPLSDFDDQLFFKKGEIYYSLGNYEKAGQSYKDFVNGYPKSELIPDAYYWIGKSAENINQFDEALIYFGKVISSNINSESGVSAVLETGKIQTNMKNYDAAISTYEKAIDKLPPESPKIGEIAYNKAMVYVTKGEISKAYNEFNYIIQYHGETIFAANSKFEIGLIELARKNYETCDLLFRELSENRNDDIGASAQYYLGESLLDQNKIDDAITALVRVRFAFSAYDEWLTKSYLKLGECYEMKEDVQRAKELYRTVLNRHRGDEYGKEAESKLRKLK